MSSMRWVRTLSEGGMEDRDLLGGKGAGLAEMTRLGLPVPPGFIVTTDACRAFRSDGCLPDGLLDEVRRSLGALEDATGRRFGDAQDPLLVSVRSGAPFSMPGMMDTVLDLGLNAASTDGLAERTGNERFALDARRRFLQMFGRVVLGVPGVRFEVAIAQRVADAGIGSERELDVDALRGLIDDFDAIITRTTRRLRAAGQCGQGHP